MTMGHGLEIQIKFHVIFLLSTSDNQGVIEVAPGDYYSSSEVECQGIAHADLDLFGNF